MEIIKECRILEGIKVSEGIIMGTVCHFQEALHEQAAIYQIADEDVEREIGRFTDAVETGVKELLTIAENIEKTIGKNEAMIFHSHEMILKDPALANKVSDIIKKDHINVEYAVKTVFEEYENLFTAMDNEYMRERSVDFRELKKRILSHLTGESGKFLCNIGSSCLHKKDRIVLAHEITPSLLSRIEDDRIVGLISEKGGANSHAGIMARSIGIPFVSGLNIVDTEECGSMVIIDGFAGKVILNPSKEIIESYKIKDIKAKRDCSIIKNNRGPVAYAANGKEVTILGNVLSNTDIDMINSFRLAGIGLLRSEFLFYEYPAFPNPELQAEKYISMIARLENKADVTIRLFDFGADKKVDTLEFAVENNPLLGSRGSRFLIANPKILNNQLEAIAITARKYPVKILYPMITTPDEIDILNKSADAVFSKFGLNIKRGIMFEVPAPFVTPRPYLERVDFCSIGTNDLVQYLFAVDRENTSVNHLYNLSNPQIAALIKPLLITAKELGKEISLCGEIGEHFDFLKEVINSGLTRLSVNPGSAQKIIQMIRYIA